MGLIWSLVVGKLLLELLQEPLQKKGESMGWIANIVAGLVGSAIGQGILGNWGPSLAGMALIPSIVGVAVILVAVVSFFF
jgi:uncharacterized membrane protein YeaQ/YmgE (transglycosylase-associated protein family)